MLGKFHVEIIMNIRQTIQMAIGCAAFAFALVSTPPSSGSDKLLGEAVTEEKTLGELSTRFQDLKERFQDSCVFSEQEVSSTGAVSSTLGKVREDAMPKIVEELGKATAVKDAADKRSGYERAGKEYDVVIKTLEKIYEVEGKRLQGGMKNKELLEAQKSLLDALKRFKQEVDNKPTTEEDLEKLATLAERQEDLRQKAENEPLKNKMDSARKEMQKMRLASAVKLQEEIVKAIEKTIEEDPANQSEFADDAEMGKLDQMEKALKEAENKLEESADGKNQLDDAQRQELAMEMAKLRQQDEQLAPELDKAVENVMSWEDKKALANVRKAKEKIKDGKKQKTQKKQKKQQKQELTDQRPQEQKNDQEKPLEQGHVKTAEAGDWQGKLPEKERAALLTARKAKFSPGMEEDVKRYFINLAQ